MGQRLADNKRFASRNSKVPSLLQGLAACSACGYGYYRTRPDHPGQQDLLLPVPGHRRLPVRRRPRLRQQAGPRRLPGHQVWDHLTGLLADPALIRAEIATGAAQARTSDPVTRQRTQLEQALAKAAASVTAMVEAFSEQLITIDELRARMPHLRARDASLRGQLDAQAADRDAYLKLAGDLEGFLARLRGNAATATVEERRRVLRLLVKDVLIGPEKITIRHRIPVREPAGAGGGHHDTTDTEGDMRQSYPLCWGRDFTVLAERRVARAGGGRRGPLPDLRHPCRGSRTRVSGGGQVRR